MAKTPSTDRNPKTRPGVTGFEQDYNDQPAPSQDLNPDVVDDPDALPDPQRPTAPKARRTRKSSKRG